MSYQSIALLTLPRKLTGNVAAHRLVTAAGAQAGADAVVLGSSCSAGSTGDTIPVDTIGTTTVEAGAAIADGATLKADASGRVITWASSGAKVGVALQAAAAAGQFIEVRLLDNA